MDDASKHAARYYHDALSSGYFESTCEALAADREFNEVEWNGRRVCNVLRPSFMTQERYAQVMRAATLVTRAIQTVYRRALVDAPLRRMLVRPDDPDAWELDAHLEPLSVIGRLDGGVSSDGNVMFIENNAAPGGISEVEVLGDAFGRLPIMQELSKRFDFRWIHTRTRAVEAVRASAARAGISGPLRASWTYASPSFAVKNWSRASVMDFFNKNGIPIAQAPLSEHECHNGQVYVNGAPINLLFGGDPMVARSLPAGLARAIKAGTVRHAVGFALQAIIGGKSLFAVLSDPKHASWFEPAVAAALARHIPWTRVIADVRTDYAGSPIDLLPFIAEHPATLVLKPCFGKGGEGVVLGWQCAPQQWREALAGALRTPYVVQERVAFAREPYPVVKDGKLAFQEMNCGCDPFHFSGVEAAGYEVRMDSGDRLNVSTGAGETPAFLVRERA